MPKSRKTRKDKKNTDQRKSTTITFAQQPALHKEKVEVAAQTNVVEKPVAVQTQTAAISTGSYNYLVKDLFKSSILTISIVIVEILVRIYTNWA